MYETNFFEDVKVEINNNLVKIEVKEYPIIQEIIINGIKRKKTIEQLKEQISLKDKNPFNKSLIKSDQNKILNIFKQSGFYFAKVDARVEINENKTVNIIYDVERGEKATIKEIKCAHFYCIYCPSFCCCCHYSPSAAVAAPRMIKNPQTANTAMPEYF